jgi:hypothetical protein
MNAESKAGPGMRALLALVLVALAPACSSTPGAAEGGRMAVVDSLGAPVQGAFLYAMPEDENPPARPEKYTSAERKARTSDAQGMLRAELDDFLWESDHCYHFRVRRSGFEDVTMSVSRDLFPPVLRIEMKRLAQATGSPQGTAQEAGHP